MKVTRISANPLIAAQEEENEALAMEKYREQLNAKNSKSCCKKKEQAPMET